MDQEFFEIRPERRRGTELAKASLACPGCDAPVVPPWRMLVTERLSCPFCSQSGTVRDFLALDTPDRPARVTLRIQMGLRVPITPR